MRIQWPPLSGSPNYPWSFSIATGSYLAMAKLAGNITVIAPGPVEAMQSSIRKKVLQALPPLDGGRPYAEVHKISY